MTSFFAVRPEFPKDGILWHEWNDDTLGTIEERDRPVVLFVANPDPVIAPFLQGVLLSHAFELERLRNLLHDYYIALMVYSRFNAGIPRGFGCRVAGTISPSSRPRD